MGQIAWDQIHFIAHLLIALFILKWVKAHMNDETSSYKALTYLLNG